MRIPVVISLSLIAALPLLAQNTGTAVDTQSMLANLEGLKQKQESASKALLNQTIGDFTTAASSDQAAIAFYAQAVQVTRFCGPG